MHGRRAIIKTKTHTAFVDTFDDGSRTMGIGRKNHIAEIMSFTKEEWRQFRRDVWNCEDELEKEKKRDTEKAGTASADIVHGTECTAPAEEE